MLHPQLLHHFEQTAKYLFVPTNEGEYQQLQTLLDELTDLVRDDETHPLVNLMEVLGVLLENYEAGR